MQFAERTIFLHLAYNIVHHLQQILLSFLHQHANFTMSKGSVQQWGCETGVRLRKVRQIEKSLNQHLLDCAVFHEDDAHVFPLFFQRLSVGCVTDSVG